MPVGPVPCIGLWREPMSLKKPEPEPPLRETIREHWSDKLELGGSKDGHVACYAANQVLGTAWRGGNERISTPRKRRADRHDRGSLSGSRYCPVIAGAVRSPRDVGSGLHV